MSRVDALVTPAVLVWARTNAGLTIEDAAKKVPVKPERLEAWEAGESHPTVNQARRLAKAYHRPLALFYLPEPPLKFKPMVHDSRRLPGQVAGLESPQLVLEIRRAEDRREIALELYRDLGSDPPGFDLRIRFEDDPEAAASKLRSHLSLSRERQASCRTSNDSLNLWRTTLESKGVLVFQATRVDLAEMRGVSLNHRPLPVVLVNGADAPNARVFSIAHELVHLALDRGSLCDLDDDPRRAPEDLKLEVFCNRVAGAVLLPAEWLLSHSLVANHVGQSWTDADIGTLARHFGVSREVVLRRMLILGRTTEQIYREKRSEYLREYLDKKEEQRGFAPPHTMAISRAGNLFVNLVLESYYRERITSANVSEYLDVKLTHLTNIEKSLRVRSSAGV